MKIAELKGRPKQVVDLLLKGYGVAEIQSVTGMSQQNIYNT